MEGLGTDLDWLKSGIAETLVFKDAAAASESRMILMVLSFVVRTIYNIQQVLAVHIKANIREVRSVSAAHCRQALFGNIRWVTRDRGTLHAPR
jgi:hypothetical protein